MFIILISIWCIVNAVDGAVLDPALYLSPIPPLMETSRDVSPGKLWARPLAVKTQLDFVVKMNPQLDKEPTKDIEDEEEPMTKAETFWPSFHTPDYVASSVHVPLTFSVSGTYGKKGPGTGVITSSYASVSGGSHYGGYGKSGLAGSSYGTYGSAFPRVRIFGGHSRPTWSGWGNGKWGHYGKG